MKSFFILSMCYLSVWRKSRYAGKYTRGRSNIVGGTETDPGEFPNQVSVQVNFGVFAYHICGGSIYSPRWVITAGQCGDVYNSNLLLQVVAGEHDLSKDEGFEQTEEVSKIIVHENFDTFTFANDIALLKLKRPFKFNAGVQPYPIPNSGQIIAEDCVVTGWGSLSSGGPSPDVLNKVTVPVISDEVCREESLYESYKITDCMMCAGYLEGGKDSCVGDTGGPLMCKGVLGGIVSWGYGCAFANYPGVYTEVSYFVAWIEKNAV